jgi:hypothetical protein
VVADAASPAVVVAAKRPVAANIDKSLMLMAALLLSLRLLNAAGEEMFRPPHGGQRRDGAIAMALAAVMMPAHWQECVKGRPSHVPDSPLQQRAQLGEIPHDSFRTRAQGRTAPDRQAGSDCLRQSCA